MSGKVGPQRDVVLLNSAAALIAADKATDFESGLKMAAESIDSGTAIERLEKLIELSSKF